MKGEENMRKWFKDVTTIEELRKRYRELLKMYHPDNEKGSVEITQEINAEYDLVFSILSREKQEDSQSYTQEENEQFKAIMNAIIGFNITIEVIGSWMRYWLLQSGTMSVRGRFIGIKRIMTN